MLPRWLPDDWKGCFVLLVLVFVQSSFLDNIAAATMGCAVDKLIAALTGARRRRRSTPR